MGKAGQAEGEAGLSCGCALAKSTGSSAASTALQNCESRQGGHVFVPCTDQLLDMGCPWEEDATLTEAA